MLKSLLSNVPTVSSYSEVAPLADALTSNFKISGAVVAQSADAVFLVGEDGVWEIPVSGVAAANKVEAAVAVTGNSVSVELSVRHGTKVILRQQYEVGVSLVPSSTGEAAPNSGGCGCSGSQSTASNALARGCPPGCWMCPNGGCCCPPMTRCLRVGCAR